MAIAVRMTQTTWEGPLASGTGMVRIGSGAAGGLLVTWAARTERAGGVRCEVRAAGGVHTPLAWR